MKKRVFNIRCATMLTLIWILAAAAIAQTPPEPVRSVFDMPRIFPYHQQLNAFLAAAIRNDNYAEGERACREAVRVMPEHQAWRYNLACMQASQGKVQEALDNLEQSIYMGFRDVNLMMRDNDLGRVRTLAHFSTLMELARSLGNTSPENIPQKTSAPVIDGSAMIETSNTSWDFNLGAFVTRLEMPEKPAPDSVVVEGMGKVGTLVNTWYLEGKAAGNHGDFYDNRDKGHSSVDLKKFPQVTRIVYGKEAQAEKADWGLGRFLFVNATVVGNSSTASTSGPFWRSTGRMAYTNARQLQLLLLQYTSNHIYLYPSHHDFAPGHGQGSHHGDVFPANTPYIVISRGSSGTDKPFMEAVLLTLGAFRPEVKQYLRQNRMLMSTVQMILRRSSKNVTDMQDYLSGAAHPVVFDKKNLDLMGMARLAQSMTTNTLPPFVQLNMQEEERMRQGRDFFDAADSEILFNSPAAIARIMRGTPYRRRYVVSAEKTYNPTDPDGSSMRFHWALLQGRPDNVQIRRLDEKGSRAEILVDYHTAFPVPSNSNILSTRVDIGVFAHNGHHVSAPAFVTFFFLPNEDRDYHADHRIRSVDYQAAVNRYVDPMLSLPRNWRDDYTHTPQGERVGWTRTWKNEAVSTFTADGLRIETTDGQGRPLTARNVTYAGHRDGGDQTLPVVMEVPGNQRFHFKYDTDTGRIGRVDTVEEIHDSPPRKQ